MCAYHYGSALEHHGRHPLISFQARCRKTLMFQQQAKVTMPSKNQQNRVTGVLR
uniref:Uncharacterized protein n=1 Tax=Picea sitchensis TaxID=3332 RepID=A0A6B9XV68_PICSI|nr:hypothetical protein Q903MT_gene4244 [Picea sitchensis]